MARHIEVVAYNPNWPKIFDEESQIIKNSLRDNCTNLHHVGSTAVVGLAAKPKIDIIAVVKNGNDSIEPLEKSGYAYRGEWNIPFKFGFTRRDTNQVNLHVLEEKHPEIELSIVFRDHLRANPKSMQQYAKIKETLLRDPSSFEKQEGMPFANYTLCKDDFIRSVLLKEGYMGKRFVHATHVLEWKDYHRIQKEQIFDPIGVKYDPYNQTIAANGHYHFILSKGMQTLSVAHIEFLNSNEAALRLLATDFKYQSEGYGREMMYLVEKWLKHQRINSLKIHVRLNAEGFYRKLGYQNCLFNDISIQPQYIALGKIL